MSNIVEHNLRNNWGMWFHIFCATILTPLIQSFTDNWIQTSIILLVGMVLYEVVRFPFDKDGHKTVIEYIWDSIGDIVIPLCAVILIAAQIQFLI